MKYAEGEDGLKGQDGVELYYDKYLKGLAEKLLWKPMPGAGRCPIT